jgi:hypothetical protein
MNSPKQTEQRINALWRGNKLILSCGCKLIFLYPDILHKNTKLCEKHNNKILNKLTKAVDGYTNDSVAT